VKSLKRATALLSCGVLFAIVQACAGQNGTTEDSGPVASLPAAPEAQSGGIGLAELSAADSNTTDWLSTGRTWSEQRYSPLDQINTETVSGLKLEWYADLDTARGQEATPLVIDGKMYVTTAWSKVFAYDAVSGDLLWKYDPQVPGETGVKPCCDVVNRGLAAWGNKLFLGSLDGRLIALDMTSGEEVWVTDTIESDLPYTITGAPRVTRDGLVVIGNGGADMGRTRGYVTAYDAETGEKAWRFWTVPDNPEKDQPEYLQMAAETWTGEWWKVGGGGTVWDAMAYDPELDLIYIGVGNGAPWNQQYRSPQGGDNLFLSSIVAIKASSGDYAWHFQTSPGDTWDFTATQHIMLADLEIEGEARKVLMQAPKNGFFYVLDRATGEFISGNNYTNVTWAKGLDPETGRPVEADGVRYLDKATFMFPGPLGGHNWHPMAFSKDEGLVYIPAQNAPGQYDSPDAWDFSKYGYNTATGARGQGVMIGSGDNPMERPDPADRIAPVPEPAVIQAVEPRSRALGSLLAWDPVTQTEKWRVEYPGLWNGGVLATGGGLVFQGTAVGDFKAFDAADGTELWSMPIQTGAVAAPMTFEKDGKQYVALLAGWGGVVGLRSGVTQNRSRMLVFSLEGEAELPEALPIPTRVLDPPAQFASEDMIAEGGLLYRRFCGVCHGGGVIPDLRYSAAIGSEPAWNAIVRDGLLVNTGMIGFGDELTDDELKSIRGYVLDLAHKEKARLEKDPGTKVEEAPRH